MKKIIAIILGIMMLGTCASAESIWVPQVSINKLPIQSVLYNQKALISVRDLEYFGFSMDWNPEESRIYLQRTVDKDCTENIPLREINIKHATYMNPTHTPYGDIESVNIDGAGFVYFKDLNGFGEIMYNNLTLYQPLENRQEIVYTDTASIVPINYEERIKGTSIVDMESARQWARDKGAGQNFIDIANYYWWYGQVSGIRPEVMYAQAALETGFGTFTGNVIPEQNNWAGIKTYYATGDTTYDHESFATPDDGVRCHYNHMTAYVGGEPIGTPHGRYWIVKEMPWAGTVQTVSELSGKWCPNTSYADTIIGFLNEMYTYCG